MRANESLKKNHISPSTHDVKHYSLKNLFMLSLVTSFAAGISPFEAAAKEHNCQFLAFWGPNSCQSILQGRKLDRSGYLLKAIFVKCSFYLAGHFSSFFLLLPLVHGVILAPIHAQRHTVHSNFINVSLGHSLSKSLIYL